jgi:hypothetical protein
MAEEEFFGHSDRDNVIEVKCLGDIEKTLLTAGQSDTGRNRLYSR